MTDFNDDTLIQEFIQESQEHLADIEPDLLALEQQGAQVNQDIVNRIFRAIHSIKGAAGFFGFNTLKSLSHSMESVLMRVRDGQLVPESHLVEPLLRGVDVLRAILSDIGNSEALDCQDLIAQLDALLEGDSSAAATVVKKSVGKKTTRKGAGALSGPSPVAADTATPPDDEEKKAWQPSFDVTDEQLAGARKKGQFLYCVHGVASRDLYDRQRSYTQLLETVGSIGQVLASTVPHNEQETVPETFVMLVGSVLEQDLMPGALDMPHGAVVPYQPHEAAAEAPDSPSNNSAEPAGQDASALPPPKPNQAAKPPAAGEKPVASGAAEAVETIRVRVDLLNKLMDFAGELVLSRNQLIREVGQKDNLDLETLNRIVQNVDLATSHIQEHIMQTRMQPIESVFRRFPRVVRDLSHQLGKAIRLEMSGQDVELDKSILESLSDPLTHIIRNCCDHGIELPADRRAAGKPEQGVIVLRAYHEGGQINLQIEDDGRGINVKKVGEKAIRQGIVTQKQFDSMTLQEQVNLIFHPGLSTAEQVSDLSGRGVGMDVVKTNIEKLGGHVALDSSPGRGTVLHMQLPLTLAIIPSLIVGVQEHKFAIPQINLLELVRVRANDIQSRIERVGRASVLRLRGKLLPLVHLADLLNIQQVFRHPRTGQLRPERRHTLEDARLYQPDHHPEVNEEQRRHPDSDYNVLVLRVGNNQYGLIVDQVFDTEEIVVKPLSRYLKDTKCFSGTTIMGDGTVAMILDASGIAAFARLNFSELEAEEQRRLLHEQANRRQDGSEDETAHKQAVILFTNHPDERFALPLGDLLRLEKIRLADIELVGSREFVNYRGHSMPLVRLEDFLPVRPPSLDLEEAYIIVPKAGQGRAGLFASQILDTAEAAVRLETDLIHEQELSGSAMINNHLTLFINAEALLHRAGYLFEPANDLPYWDEQQYQLRQPAASGML